MEYMPAVIQAVAGKGLVVYAYFSDGTVRKADVSGLVERGGVFSRLEDRDFFENNLTVLNDAVAWDVMGDRDESRCIDLDPIAMYESAEIVSDPLECEAFVI